MFEEFCNQIVGLVEKIIKPLTCTLIDTTNTVCKWEAELIFASLRLNTDLNKENACYACKNQGFFFKS